MPLSSYGLLLVLENDNSSRNARRHICALARINLPLIHCTRCKCLDLGNEATQ